MKSLVGLLTNAMAVPDGTGAMSEMQLEVVMVLSEPEYVPDKKGELTRVQRTETVRWAGNSKRIRAFGNALLGLADSMDRGVRQAEEQIKEGGK